MKMLIDMLRDIEERPGTAPPPEASPLTPADEEMVENLLARLRRAELEDPPRRHAVEYCVLLRRDLVSFAQGYFSELNRRIRFARSWHVEIIAAKLTVLRGGKIRRVIINMSRYIDFIGFIFHPTRFRRPTASLDGSWVE